MGIRVHRTVAQTVVGLGVLALLGAGVWLAVGSSGEVAECFRTAPRSRMPTCPVEVVPEVPPQPAYPYSLGALVPETSGFVVSTSWSEVRRSPWFKRRILRHRLVANPLALLSRVPDSSDDDETPLWDPLKLLEPELGPHSVEEDIFAGEVVLAGDIDGEADPARGRPGIGLNLVLARVSPRYAEALSMLTLEEAKKRIHPDVELTMLDGGIVRVHSTRREFTPVYGHWKGISREIRHVPLLPLYVYRSNDVVAFSHLDAVMREVAKAARALEEQPGLARFMSDVPKAQPGGLSAWFDLEPLHYYVNRAMVHFGAPLCLLRRWFAVTTLGDLDLTFDASDPTRMRAAGELHHEPGRATPIVRTAYLAEPLSLEAVAARVPAEDTVALLSVRCPSEWVLRSIFADLIWPVDHKKRKERRRTGSWQEALVDSLGDTWALALARRSDMDDAIDYDEFTGPRPSSVPRTLTWAVIVDLAEDASAADVSMLVERLSDRLYGNPTEPVAYRGHMLHVGAVRLGDPWWVPAAWLVTDEVVVMTNCRAYLERLVDTRLDPEESLARNTTWRETFAELPGKAHVGGFVDLEKLYRAPTTTLPGGLLVGLLWDRRRASVWKSRLRREEETRTRSKLSKEVRSRLARPLNAQDRAKIDREVRREMANWKMSAQELEKAQGQELRQYAWMRGLGFTIVVDGATMHLRGFLGARDDAK